MAGFRTQLRENDLREILLHDSLDLHYLPRIDLRNGQIIGMEALVRWPLFETRTMTPAKFLSAAQHDELLQEMGERILSKACVQTVEWMAEGHLGLRLAISLAPAQLAHRDSADRIIGIVEAAGLPAVQLELQFSEKALMQALEHAPATLLHLRRQGFRIGVEEFGSGHLALSALRRDLISTLKLPAAFVSGLGLNPDDDAIISAIITTARNLGLATVADGVETKEQVARLRREGCDLMQGRFHSRPMAPRDFAETLELYRLLDKTRGAAARLNADIRGYPH